ncbi:amidohydrolase family protein (plasmid) [Aliirhizobium terrae]|uniref:amidohydrolase family protein n=1 Tax=Terrirhizobium terrae TaxID=2926709 RepID=UPI002574CAF0|nr:amidohydrolase family protein [Rhizobium sp. CC-CFT758]WJH37827.1 amidohydrolase family protein [Rhizobium sp. CC-CFT758]
MIIDAHQHFWLMKDRHGGWPPPELAAIHRDFLPADLAPEIDAVGVGGTVLVQSLPSVEDTRFMLGLAEKSETILGVIGWVDMKAPDAPVVIAELAKAPKLKGLRPMLQDIADPTWIDDPALDAAIVAMLGHGLVFDALVLEPHLVSLEAFARLYPDLPVVIDHGAKPRIAEGHYRGWRQGMQRLAGLGNVCCKLSGLLTEAGDQKPEAVRPYVETILELFGAERVIWGSDWPVVNLAGSYVGWIKQCREIVPDADHAAVFGNNARRFYRL